MNGIWTKIRKFTEIKTTAGANRTDQTRKKKPTTSVWIVSSFPMFYYITEKNQAKFFLFPHFLITNNYASYNKDPCKLISLVNGVPLFYHRADSRTDGRYTGERASSTLLTGKTKRNRWRGKKPFNNIIYLAQNSAQCLCVCVWGKQETRQMRIEQNAKRKPNHVPNWDGPNLWMRWFSKYFYKM